MKQFLLYLTQFAVPTKRRFLVSIFLLGFCSVFGQNAIVGSGFSSGWGGGGCPTGSGDFKFLASNAGGTFGLTTTANGTGDQYFRFGVDWSGTTAQLTKTIGSDEVVVPNTKYSLNTTCTTNGSMKYNVPSTSFNYVFKTLNTGSNPTGTFVFFEVQGAVRSVATVTQSPSTASVNPCLSITVTATLNGALAAGQGVYLRYTKDGYTTSTVVSLIGSGITYTATIPSSFNTAGANVSYYLFTSGTTTPSGVDADFYTINLNNNGDANYSYTVAAGGATTAIPDPKFEQALISLGLDCAIDGQVFTSNISGVTLLDIRDKSIVNMAGLEGFTSLEELYCNNEEVGDGNDNAITTLNVSGFPNLIRLYCENNQITNLNISGLTKLEALDTSNNPFLSTTLDVHLNPNLYYLVCQNNGLTNLDISGLTNLETLIVWDNSLTAINLSANPKISYLDCDENLFTSLDVSKLVNLNQFYCSGNELTNLDVRGLTNLANFVCTYNPFLTCILVDNVAAANTATVTNDPTNNPPSPFWQKDAGALYSYCACDLTTTWNGTSWTPVAPVNGTYAAIISGNYNASANISACSLTIKNGANVTIPSSFNVTLNAPIVVEAGGSFTLNNNANLVQTNKKSVNNGVINVNRDSSSLFRLDYAMWSSPVSGTQTLGGFSPLTSTNRFHEYDTATDLYSAVPSTDPFGLAKGYLIRMPNTWVDYVVSPPSTPLSWTGTFMGTPNNGDVSLAVTNGSYNATGNPYPSTISADTFISYNGITEALYFWRKKNNENQATAPTTSYATYTLAGGTGTSPSGGITPNGTIQVGQGFIAKSTSTSLKFTNAMRTANNVNQILKTRNTVERNRIWLNLTSSAGAFSQMMVAYMPGATQDIDAAIDGRYFNDSKTALNSLISSEEFAIQGRALPFDGTDIVPLAFKTNLAGDYTISIDHVDGLFSGNQEVYLLDNTTGTETNLKGGAYTFTAVAGTDNARFSLKYQRTLGVNNAVFNVESVTIHKNKGTLYVNSGGVVINNIKVFDIQGRLIAEQKNVKSNTTTIKDLKAVQQVLIVKITSQDNKVVSKKVVN